MRDVVEMIKGRYIMIIILLMLLPARTFCAQSPDELYEQGKFSDAAELYNKLDMDHPKDIRYRFNRGCAAYQAGDYETAEASFSSTYRRTEDHDMRFNAMYNLGNTAYKKGDFGSSIEYYKKAVIEDPENEDVRHNLELALKAFEQQQQQEQQQGQEKEQGQQQQQDSRSSPDEGSKEDGSPSDSQEDSSKGSSKDKQDEESEPGQEQAGSKSQDRPADSDGQKDLEGKLEGPESPAGTSEEQAMQDYRSEAIERQKADAMLENIREDRSRYIQLQVPEGAERGSRSGKDW